MRRVLREAWIVARRYTAGMVIKVIVGWAVLIPLGFLIRKRSNSVVFMGKEGGYLDNARHLFVYFHSELPAVESCLLVQRRDTYRALRSMQLPVTYHPSILSFYRLLRASIVIADCNEWVSLLKGHASYFSKRIQLWHGVGFKKIELLNYRDTQEGIPRLLRPITALNSFLSLRFPTYDIVVTTSQFYKDKVFIPAFRARDVCVLGYPRNDLLVSAERRAAAMANATEEEKRLDLILREHKDNRRKVLLYAPTFRDSWRSPLSRLEEGFASMVERFEENDILFLLRFHPKDSRRGQHWGNILGLKNVIDVSDNCDIYLYLHYVDGLITDYSSIYMDFLLLDRPIVYFIDDYEEYLEKDRGFQFAYETMTPGLKCSNLKELRQSIESIWVRGEDGYEQARREMQSIAFEYRDGKASRRIAEYISNKYLSRV